MEARPYVAGTLDEDHVTLESLNLPTNGSYDMKSLRNQPSKRQPVSSMSSIDAAKRALSSDWYYYSPYEAIYDYENLNWYDYFLVRGYAFVSSAGLGTKGSEGFNTTGSDLEIEAFKILSNGSMVNERPTQTGLIISKSRPTGLMARSV